MAILVTAGHPGYRHAKAVAALRQRQPPEAFKLFGNCAVHGATGKRRGNGRGRK
jgi:hypothetical protein